MSFYEELVPLVLLPWISTLHTSIEGRDRNLSLTLNKSINDVNEIGVAKMEGPDERYYLLSVAAWTK